MKQLITALPYTGLVLLAAALIVRGFQAEGLDLAEFPRPPQIDLPGEILAQGTEGLAGRVVDSDKSPIAEALVLVDLNGELAWDYTDEQGFFAITKLPAGELSLTVLARKFTTKRMTAASATEDLVIDLGEPVPPPPTLSDLGESDLEGELIASIAGRGLLGYEVQLVPVLAPEVFGAPTPVRTEVSADRTFKFPALLHGEYRVLVLPPWARAGSWPNLVDPEQGTLVHSPAVKRVQLAIRAGEIAGRLIDTQGEFVQGALVLVEPVGASGRPWLPEQSNKTGGFLVQQLPPGKYRLQVFAGEARIDELVEVLSGVTSEVDLPPLAVRGKE